MSYVYERFFSKWRKYKLRGKTLYLGQALVQIGTNFRSDCKLTIHDACSIGCYRGHLGAWHDVEHNYLHVALEKKQTYRI